MEKINEAVTRSSRQMIATPASSLVDFADEITVNQDDLAPTNVLLDPDSDAPLKLFLVHCDDIPRLGSSWQPPLYLTAEERYIVEQEGNVLLLGRSGTGKTVCICNRIDFDCHLMERDPTYSATFVARSRRICRYVQESMGHLTVEANKVTFSTFDELLKQCEEFLFGASDCFPHEGRVSFPQFKALFGELSDGDLDPLIVWTSIKSFIKGSIEAVMEGRPLSRKEYLDTNIIGSRRCRLSQEQRHEVYNIYEKYQRYMSRASMRRWDDCDRVNKVVAGLRHQREARLKLSRRRVYVDEIQDFTQVDHRSNNDRLRAVD